MHYDTYLKATIYVLESLRKDFRKINDWLALQLKKFGFHEDQYKIAYILFSLFLFLFLILAIFAFGIKTVLIQLLGILGMTLILKAATFKENRHNRTSSSLGGVLTTLQMALLHAWGGLLQTSFATFRAFLMAALHDDMKKTRLVSTALFYVVGLYIYQFILPSSPYNILPLITMTLGTTGDFFPSSMSHQTRFFYMLGAGAMIPYHMVVSHSLGGVGLTAGTVILLYCAARRYDIPTHETNGAKIGFLKSHFLWLKSLLHERASDK